MKLILKITMAIALLAVITQPMAAKDKSVSYNLSRAFEEIQQDNWQSALEYLDKEVKDNPKNGYAYFLISTISMDNSKYSEARNAVESALKYLPKKDKKSLSQIYLGIFS